MSRAGAKRKFRGTTPGGRANMHRLADDALAAQQPHRAWLPQDKRLSHKAGTVLGELNLQGKLTDEHYEAGQQYAVIVHDYAQSIDVPMDIRTGHGKSYPCLGDRFCDPCECKYRKDRYDRALEAVMNVGEQCAKVVARVAVHNEGCPYGRIGLLQIGLDALARYFGLTNNKIAHKA